MRTRWPEKLDESTRFICSVDNLTNQKSICGRLRKNIPQKREYGGQKSWTNRLDLTQIVFAVDDLTKRKSICGRLIKIYRKNAYRVAKKLDESTRFDLIRLESSLL